MARLIDGDALIAWIKGSQQMTSKMKSIICYIKTMPTIEARPKGEWIVYEGGWKDLDYYPPKCKCNQCGYEEELYILNAKPTNFCPNCGSDNREREGE